MTLLQQTLNDMLRHQIEQDEMAKFDGILEPENDSWVTARVRYCLALMGDNAQWEILNNRRVELCYKEFHNGLSMLEANYLNELQLLADMRVEAIAPIPDVPMNPKEVGNAGNS